MERTKFLVATHIFLLDWEKILLYLRKWGSQDSMYNLIAWHLDGNESPIDATIREAKEEAWINIKRKDLNFERVAYSPLWDGREYIQFYFSCRNWSWTIKNMELDRCYGMDFFPINNLPKNITPYIKEAINDYINTINYSEF
jgi:8-oxo-dGTP pyrophosphatase MutT (NUDIX family)